MMNDMMPTIEETLTPDIAAEIEFREWERGNEEREREERWAAAEAAHEAKHGRPLFTSTEWDQHTADMNQLTPSSATRTTIQTLGFQTGLASKF
jgi:hypothetical protein